MPELDLAGTRNFKKSLGRRMLRNVLWWRCATRGCRLHRRNDSSLRGCATHSQRGRFLRGFLPPALASFILALLPIREDLPDEIPKACHQLRRGDEDILVSSLLNADMTRLRPEEVLPAIRDLMLSTSKAVPKDMKQHAKIKSRWCGKRLLGGLFRGEE